MSESFGTTHEGHGASFHFSDPVTDFCKLDLCEIGGNFVGQAFDEAIGQFCTLGRGELLGFLEKMGDG